MENIEVNSIWQHTNGNKYTVIAIANDHSYNPDTYPVTVVYQDENLRTWSRRLSDWHRSMKKI